MANDFSWDARCVSVYRFESGALTTDSKASNTLQAVNTPSSETGADLFVEGSGSAKLVRSSSQYFQIADASLPANWPFKNGGSYQEGTYCGWLKWINTDGDQGLLGRNRATGSCGVFQYYGMIHLDWNYYWQYVGYNVSPGIWYHFAVTMDGPNGDVYLRIYRASDGNVFTYTKTDYAAHDAGTDPFRLGSFGDGYNTFYGYMDEVVIFNDLLVDSEIDAIRQQTYSEPPPPDPVEPNDFSRDKSCLCHYRFEDGALTTDSKGLMNLNASANPPTVYLDDYKEGLACAQFTQSLNTYYYVTDANLPSDFPMKNGESGRTFTICCWVKGSGASQKTIWNKWVSGQYSMILFTDPATGTFRLGDGAYYSWAQTVHDSGVPFYAGEWYHVAVAVDGGSSRTAMIRIYKASTGVVSGAAFTLTYAGQLWLGTADFRIGSNQDNTTQAWNGLIDEFVIFNRYLNVDEIDAVRSGTYTGPKSFPTPNYGHVPVDMDLSRALNNPNLSFSTGGDADWAIENNETHDGAFAVKSGSIGLNQESWLSTTVCGPGTLTFWWAVDSTADQHYLEFLIDEVFQHNISGPNNPGAWERKSYTVPRGSHILKWRYYTNGHAIDNRNAGWVDEILFGEANDFIVDSSCKALFKFENNVRLGFDSIGANHLRDGNGVNISPYNSAPLICRRGSQAAYFARANANHMWLADSALDSGFPLRNDDTTKTGTYCLWMRLNPWNNYVTYDVINKGSTSSRCFQFCYRPPYGWYVYYGYSGGNQEIQVLDNSTVVPWRWYHVSISFDGTNRRVYCRIWDDEAKKIVCDQVWSPANVMQVGTGGFGLGIFSGTTDCFDGFLDEVVIFNRQLSIIEMDSVRKGIFSGTEFSTPVNDFSSDSSCKALWKFESGSKLVDSKSSNTLTDHSTVQITNVTDTTKEGSGCVQCSNSSNWFLNIADADLAAGFPLKSGDTAKKISVCLWFRPFENNANYRSIIAKRAYAANMGSFLVYTDYYNRVWLSYVYGSGPITQDYQIGTIPNNYAWYHLGLTIDGVNRKITARLYNSYVESTSYCEFYPGAELQVDSCDWVIGGEQGSSSGTSSSPFNGYIDEVVVFNRCLDILEVDAIRQGTYSGTGIEGIATNQICALAAYRTANRQTHFCVDPFQGKDLENDGLNYQRPWRSHAGKFLSPGDIVTFPNSPLYLQSGTATVTSGSLTVVVTEFLLHSLFQYDTITFGTDNVLYAIKTITATTITLYRPYRGTTASGVAIYKVGCIVLTDWNGWNSNSYRGTPDLRIELLGGVDRTSGLQVGWSLFDFQNNYGFSDSAPFLHYSRFGITKANSNTFNVSGSGCLYEDIFVGYSYGGQMSLSNCFQSIWNRIVLEAGMCLYLDRMSDCIFNDVEAFSTSDANLLLGNLSDIVFNRFRSGGGGSALYLNSSNLRNIIFNDPVFDEGVAHVREILLQGSQTIESLSFINAKLNTGTPTFSYNGVGSISGDISFEHYNQTQNDNRTFLFNGLATTAPTALMYRDATTFRTSIPSVRIDLSSGSLVPTIQKFLVPGAAEAEVTISVYIRMNAAYVSGYCLLPTMKCKTIQGSTPNFTWAETEVSAVKLSDTWLLLTQTVVPSINNIIEVFLYFQSSNPSAQCWYDDFDVSV